MTRQQGFTLLEMMVALAIFALVSLMGYQILQGVMRNGEVTQQHAEQLGDAGRLFALLQLDLSQAMLPSSPERVADDDVPFYARSGEGEILRLTRRNWLNPNRLPHSSLQRVAWRFSNGTLQRLSLSEGRLSARFEGVRAITLRFWSGERWLDNWPAGNRLPLAVEITLNISPWGKIERIVLLSGVAA